ncbi:MAG TPA: hypothetical protein VHL11_24710 [Phototrophicaceae bacterium]|jgi:hypothetical protein|nr:hypothetical protein [Phototrophicaceae bacterium]
MTAQFHEHLILEGTPTSMAFCPPIPTDHPQIVALTQEEVSAGIEAGAINRFVHSTACWRGYIGTWELKDGKFYLVSISGHFKVISPEPIFADWVTAVLRIPEGERLHYVHMGFGSVYEFERHIKIEKGLVLDERRIDNRNKDVSKRDLGWENLPGGENHFDGDDL